MNDKTAAAFDAEKIADQFIECCRPGLVKLISSLIPPPMTDADSPALATVNPDLAAINAKDHLSTSEAAALLGCSDSHVRNLVERARRNKASVPIPFQDLDGVLRFQRAALIEWRGKPKPRATKGGKTKPQLAAVY